ncbi:MAG: hypothetical protein WBS33_11280 [Verrucomicrobiia bacterium]
MYQGWTRARTLRATRSKFTGFILIRLRTFRRDKTANCKRNLCKTGAPSNASVRSGRFSKRAEAVLGAPNAGEMALAEISESLRERPHTRFHFRWSYRAQIG